jgi:hypothetical protein
MKTIAAIILLTILLSCKKREPEIKIFEGSWRNSTVFCPKASTSVDIEFVEVIGAKSKHRNKYKVINGLRPLSCSQPTQSVYYMYEFNIESFYENSDLAEASDGNLLTFKIEKNDIMRITCSCGWKLTLSRVK